MRFKSAPVAPEVRRQTTAERAASQWRERQEELRHTASDEKRWDENRNRVISKRKKAEKKKEGITSCLDEILKKMEKTRNDFKSDIPKGPHRKYYRGDLPMYPPSLPDSYPDLDERLSSIIKHTSRTSGSAGDVQSLTSNVFVAEKFAQSREGIVYEIDASEGLFMSAGDIIFSHGDRLVNLKRIQAGTLRAAVEHFYQDGESEYFWMGRR